ncbi:AAA family ATPase [Gluconacetobacter takamatsuzukensis]|uniref:Pilus assembly protein n=1 Tax=Gluconacetobacter takamatsuzukensis TaxID=1286190 RepID=A0A7W4KD74_9PROT|nr:pilus assembly protein [Gluconacetobacter takamatsuzukensis]MBB2204797.1 pilus assembly protein [Gluconacetobacter takamatsuzukensis]
MADNNAQFSAGGEEQKRPVRVLAIAQDMETEEILSDFLNTVCPEESQLLRMSVDQARNYLSHKDSPPYVILDICGSADPLATVRTFKGLVPPDVKMMLIGDRGDVNFYRSVTHGYGVSEYLYRPLNRNLVVRFFGDVILHGQKSLSSPEGGSFVMLTGIRNGVGASTLLANLGWYVAEEVRRHTLLVDFNLQSSRLGILLNAEDNYGLQVVIDEPDRMDDLLVERSLQPVSDRLKLLSSLGNIGQRSPLPAATLGALIDFVRGQFHFVMTEMDWSEGEIYFSLLEHARSLVLVLDPTLVSVRDTLRLLAALPRVRLSAMPILVLNQYGRPGTLSMEEIRKSLNAEPDIVIPYLPKECGEAEINGVPIIKTSKQYRAAIRKLASDGLSLHLGAEGSGDATNWLNRVLKGNLRRR